MKKQTKTYLVGTAALACALTAGVAYSNLTVASAETHSVTIGGFAADNSYCLSATAANSGIRYNLTGTMDLENKTGFALRVKNLSENPINIKQMMVYDSESTLVYSPYVATSYFYSVDGTVTSATALNTSSTRRFVTIPAEFDGYVMMPFDQMTIVRFSGVAAGTWDWNQTGHLSAESEGDWGMPKGSCNQIDFYLIDSTGYDFMIGAHTTYTISENNVTLDTPVYMDASTKVTPSQSNVSMATTHNMQINANDLDTNAYVISPSSDVANGVQYTFAGDGVAMTGKTGLAIRIKNTSNSIVKPYQFRIFDKNSTLVYSPHNSKIKFYDVSGKYQETSHSAREVHIPASFDGWMVIPFNQMKTLRKANSEAWYWNESGYVGSATEGHLAPPTGIWNQFAFYMPANTNSIDLVVGAHTAYTENNGVITFDAPAYLDIATVEKPSGEPCMDVYGISSVNVTLTAGANVTLSETTATVKYGETYNIKATIPVGYMPKVTIGEGDNAIVTESLSFVHNFINTSSLNVKVEAAPINMPTFEVSEENVSLSDKKGIKIAVNNANGEQIDFTLKLTEGTKFFSANGVGLFEDNNVVRFGNVFSIPAGYVGNIYVPFNYLAGGYGQPQCQPFDYTNKPASVTGKVYIDTATEKSVIESVFTSVEYVTALPATTKADLTNANLYKNGATDFIGGLLADASQEKAANMAGSGTTWGITYKFAEPVSFNQAGFAVRFKNMTGSEYGIRSYFIANGKTYVPQGANVYTLIDSEGVATTITDKNRNMLIPADFDGTIVINFADFATDSAGTAKENVNRESLTVTAIDFYVGSKVGVGAMFGEAAWIGYNGQLSGNITYTTATVVDKNASIPFTFKAVGTPVTINTTDVTLSAETVVFGSSVVTATPVAGKMITSLTAPEGCVVTPNQDGTYTIAIENPYTLNAESFALTATVDTILEVTATITGNGTVSYNGLEVNGKFFVGASAAYTLVVTPAIGYEATVKVGDTVIEATAEGYVIPVGTTAISVKFTVLPANLTVSVGENGTATMDGVALVNGTSSVEQGKTFIVVATPAKGYAETVMLGDVALEKGANGYEVLLTADTTLAITFAKVEYTITYDLDRGENAETNPATYTVDDEVVFADATKDGYVFVGWFTIKGGSEVQITKIEAGSVGNIEVFAKFEVEEVTPEPTPGTDGGIMDQITGMLGCNGTVSAIGMGIVALAAAAIVLKKKED